MHRTSFGPVPSRRARRSLLAGVGLIAATLVLAACTSPPARPRSVSPNVAPGPAVLSGTIGSMATISGIQPSLVSGYGFIVGLDGTGGGPLPEAIAGSMERIMGLMDITQANDDLNSPLAGMSPQELLRDPNTAVVLVQAVVPPGAPQGMTFDVYVRALNATSIEGGRLWTTELRIGPPAVFGGYQTIQLAEARGEIFVNPFVEPGVETRGTAAVVGRVLDGGVIVDPLEMLISLDTPSHARARSVTAAINSRFPESTGDRGPIARGRDDESVALRMPAAYRERPVDFLKLVEHLHINASFPSELARRYAAALREQPELAEELSWALQAVGEPSVPFLRDLYDAPEIAPRLAALDAGVRLGDARATRYLMSIAGDRESAVRGEAIRLLGEARGGPEIDLALKDLLGESELTVRVPAYEALAARAERATMGRLVRAASQDPRTRRANITLAEVRARVRAELRGSENLQGISRRAVEGKFVMDVVPYGPPMIYVTQQGLPRIVLFGSNLQLTRGAFVDAWSDRLMLDSESSAADEVRLFYRDYRTGRATTQTLPPQVDTLVRYLAHNPTPERPTAGPRLGPGLSLTYSEVVGALYAIYEDGGVNASFATERDRLLADLLDAGRAQFVEDRPESADDEEIILFEAPEEGEKPKKGPRKPLVVPLNRPTPIADAG
ncbi:MAG: flagellar basal body P-ring protein FlgI [Planctomycetota bacterium]